MKLSRNAALVIHFVIDELLPPIVRESRWLMWLPFRLVLGDRADLVLDFKERAPTMSDEEFRLTYERVAPVNIDRDTDLNARCVKRIERDVTGPDVLEVGCGRGWLAGRLSELGHSVTAVDIRIPETVASRFPNVRFEEASLESQPFADSSFDTVVCTHVLEHARDLHAAIAELRRVARRRLIVVVPRQRNYRYTFDLHLHFFPHPHDLVLALGSRGRDHRCVLEGGDLYYVENLQAPPPLLRAPRE